MASTVAVYNGPNLDRLGKREPGLYGTSNLDDIAAACRVATCRAGVQLDFRQTNHEGQLIDWVHEAGDTAGALVINAAAWSHTSIALHDALRLLTIPVIEVHLTNIYRRERFRHHSHVSTVAHAVICGLGLHGYVLATEAAARLIEV